MALLIPNAIVSVLQCVRIEGHLTERIGVVKQSFVEDRTELQRLALCLLLLAVCCTVVCGQEPDRAADVAERATATQAVQPETAEKERVVTAAVFLLVLVVIVGAALLLAVILWGRSVRRIARKPTARISPGDELWYLKPDKTEPPKQPATETEPQEPDAEQP